MNFIFSNSYVIFYLSQKLQEEIYVFLLFFRKDELMEIKCAILRGGTSKGVYILEENLPANGKEWDKILLKLMGSPDKRQIDGLGGATSVTSKVAIIKKSERPDADVDYTFAQVSVDKAVVSYAGNCGNISSGVGPFSIESGLVAPKEGITQVTVFNTNTKKVIVEDVTVKNGQVQYEGDFSISGVPGTAAPVKMSFLDPAGSVTGKLLPTGNTKDYLDVPGIGVLEVSFVDATNPLVFVRAKDIGLRGTELPKEINNDPALLEKLEKIRGAAAMKLGFISALEESATVSPGVPKLTIVSPAADYTAMTRTEIKKEQIDFVGRMMSMQKAHETYALTGAACSACAAGIPGTIVHELVKPKKETDEVVIGHPSGLINAGAEITLKEKGELEVRSVHCYRTARLLMYGIARV